MDLLSTQEYGSLVYRFGIDKNEQCYIEFPSWMNEIIKNGIYVNYITTNGEEGNVASGILTMFANDVTLKPIYGQYDFDKITLNSSNVFMKNVDAIVNGKNPDAIEQMYANYKKVAGTFNTLVTLRDYNSKIRNLSEYVSNGFVCDRTNDIQSAYNIIHTQGDYTRRVRKEEVQESPYALKLYMTQFVNTIDSPDNYNKSFNFVDNFGAETIADGEEFGEAISNSVYDVVDNLEEYKCMSHDFEQVKRYKPLFFKNKYPINCSIIPRYKLTNEQLLDVKNNVVNALYNLLKASSVEFGQGISYDKVYETIMNADNRISNIALEDIQYTTYAVYRGSYIKASQTIFDTEDDCRVNDKLIEVPVNQMFYSYFPPEAQYLAKENNGAIVVGHYDAENNSFTDLSGQTLSYGAPQDEFINLDGEALDKYIYFYEAVEDKFYPIDKYNGVWKSPLQIYDYPFGTAFATDIYAKSVLNGNTPIVVPDNTFNRSIKQYEDGEEVADYITTEATIEHGDIEGQYYTVRPNEAIQVFSQSYETSITWSIGVKMSYSLNHDILPNQDYILQSGEYILVFRQLEDQQDYQWKLYKEGDTIRVSRTLRSSASAEAYPNPSYVYNMSSSGKCGPDLCSTLGIDWNNNNIPTMGTTVGKSFLSGNPKIAMYSSSVVSYNGDGTEVISTITDFVRKCMIFSQDILSGNDTLEKRSPVMIELDNNYMYFWTLNSSVNGRCILFEENESEKTLFDNEMFFYSSGDGSAMGVLGAGTRIVRNTSQWNSEWSCEKKSIVDFYNYNASERKDLWVKIGNNNTLTAYEQTITSFGETSEVKIGGGLLPDGDLKNALQSLEGLTVYYKSQDGEENELILSTPAGSRIKSALQLVATESKAQELFENQVINIVDEDGNILHSIEGDASDKIFILTDRACDYSGENVDVRLITLSNDYVPLYVMSFKEVDFSNNNVNDFVLNSNNGVDFTSDGSAISFKTAFAKGNYLIPFKHSSIISSPIITIQFDGESAKTLTAINGATTFNKGLTYYIDVEVENDNYTEATITISNTDSGSIVELGSMFKYDMPEALKQGEDNSYNGKSYYWYIVMQRIKELDPNNEFDYGYQILDAERIDNPLEASSFNNPVHIMNQFTICEMDIDAMKKDNVSMGSIRILNNVRS